MGWIREGHYEKMAQIFPEKKQKVKIKKSKRLNFYLTDEWIYLRDTVLSLLENICFKCGNINNIHVDHIYPKSLYPYLALDIENLQLLCRNCNYKKLNINVIDYRTTEQKQILIDAKQHLHIPK